MVEDIAEVSQVVIQNNIMYDEILAELKPDYVIHGDNSYLYSIRQNVIENLEKYGGKLIEIPYTYNERVKKLITE